jgi:hypothetical protein
MAAHAQGSPEALIIARLDAARATLGAEVREVRQRLDVRTRLRQSVLTRPLVWLGGSAAVGLAASLLLRRRSRPAKVEKVEKERGIFGFLLGSAFSLARPALQAWAMKELRNRFAPPPQDPWRHD